MVNIEKASSIGRLLILKTIRISCCRQANSVLRGSFSHGREIPLLQGKGRLVKYYNLARIFVFEMRMQHVHILCNLSIPQTIMTQLLQTQPFKTVYC